MTSSMHASTTPRGRLQLVPPPQVQWTSPSPTSSKTTSTRLSSKVCTHLQDCALLTDPHVSSSIELAGRTPPIRLALSPNLIPCPVHPVPDFPSILGSTPRGSKRTLVRGRGVYARRGCSSRSVSPFPLSHTHYQLDATNREPRVAVSQRVQRTDGHAAPR